MVKVLYLNMNSYLIYHFQNLLEAITITLVLTLYNSTNVYVSVLLLILVFLFYFLFLCYVELDFISQAFLIIYAGAIVILFILIMMVFESVTTKQKIYNIRKKSIYFNISSIFILLLLLLLFFVLFLCLNFSFLIKQELSGILYFNYPFLTFFENSNIHTIGNHLFEYFSLEMFLFGLLLIIVIFSVSLFLNKTAHVKN